MTATVTIERAGPMVNLQDLGRPGFISLGLSVGGAMDRLALLEAAALLGLPRPVAAMEMAGMGLSLRVDSAVRFALTGAPMTAQIDGTALAWNASHTLAPGQKLSIAGVLSGSYGYLTFAGGIAAGHWLNSSSAHFAAGIGGAIVSKDQVLLGVDPNPGHAQNLLKVDDRFDGGTIRIMPGPQTSEFDAATRERFAQTSFLRSPQANRQGVRLDQPGDPFAAPKAAKLVSDFITCGDVQMTGDGLPYVLLAECQTIGGYPRIGTVVTADLARVAQAPLGARLRFDWLSNDAADALYQTEAATLALLRSKLRPMRRNPADMHDLLSYQLISGVTRGDELEQEL
jgi:5-oxoprolinase (ATP-hydrolysing) subunit C